MASATVGSSYNYVATRRMGKIAKTHSRHRAEFTGELRHLLDPERTYGPLFLAAALYMARIDGEASSEEHELYKAMLSRIKLMVYTQSEFQRLLDNETALVEAASGLRGTELQRSLVEMVT